VVSSVYLMISGVYFVIRVFGGTNSRLTFTNDAELYVHLVSRF
jgi:hypothetical protein